MEIFVVESLFLASEIVAGIQDSSRPTQQRRNFIEIEIPESGFREGQFPGSHAFDSVQHPTIHSKTVGIEQVGKGAIAG